MMFGIFFSQVKKDEELDTRRAVAVVESILQMFIERMGTVTDYYEHWKVHVSTGKEFKTQWAQFVAEARKVRGLCKWLCKLGGCHPGNHSWNYDCLLSY